MSRLPIAELSGSIHDLAGRSGALDSLMSFAAQDLVFAAVLVFAVLWLRRDGLRAGIAAGVGAVLAVIIAGIVGSIHPESRPFVSQHFTPLFSHADDAAFPSDHLSALGAVAAGAWLSWRPLGAAAGLLAAVVGFARVYAGVHWVADVVAGFAIGVAAAVAVWYALTPLLGELGRLDHELRRRGLRRWLMP